MREQRVSELLSRTSGSCSSEVRLHLIESSRPIPRVVNVLVRLLCTDFETRYWRPLNYAVAK